MWTKADLAAELNIGLNYFSQTLCEKGCPALAPDLNAGRLNLYSDRTAERWLAAYKTWRKEEPARKAAIRREVTARVRAEMEVELNRLATEQKVMAEMQKAQAQAEGDRAAFAAAASKG